MTSSGTDNSGAMGGQSLAQAAKPPQETELLKRLAHAVIATCYHGVQHGSI